MAARKKTQKTISFQAMDCLRCGTKRVLGQPCDECQLKPPPGEVNAFVVQRRTAVARIEQSLAALPETQTMSSSLLPSYEEVGGHLEEFIEALRGLIADPLASDSVARIVETERQLREFRHRCSATPRLRPSIAQHKAVTQIIAQITELWPTYAKALQAPTREKAQRLAAEGQAHIDAATKEVTTYTSLVESTRAYEDFSTPDLLDRSLKALSITYPGLTLIDLGRHGAQEAERLTGVPVTLGQGAQFLILDAVASVHFDPERFRDLLREASRLCVDSSRLADVASQPDALEGLARSTRLLYEALAVFESALLRETDEQALMRRIIKFYGEFYEDVASPVLAWYNLVTDLKTQPYAKLIQKDATELARSLTRLDLRTSLLQEDGAWLRNASQHGNSFTTEGQYVAFRLRSHQETVHRLEVVDRVFSFIESVAAMGWALSNALAQAGVEVPLKDEDASYMNLTPFRLATLSIENSGTRIADASQDETSWSLTLLIDHTEVFSSAVALATNAPEGISQVSVRTPAATNSLVVPFAAYEKFTANRGTGGSPLDSLLAVLELRASCSCEGKPVLVTSDLRYAVAAVGIHLLADDDLSLITYLRRLLALTTTFRAAEITQVIKQVFALTRSPDANVKRQLAARLNEWLNDSSAPTVPQTAAVTIRK